MTKREIAIYLSRHTGFAASHINVNDFCNDYQCKPFDIQAIVFNSSDNTFIIQFKKYFKYAFVNMPRRYVEMYLKDFFKHG